MKSGGKLPVAKMKKVRSGGGLPIAEVREGEEWRRATSSQGKEWRIRKSETDSKIQFAASVLQFQGIS